MRYLSFSKWLWAVSGCFAAAFLAHAQVSPKAELPDQSPPVLGSSGSVLKDALWKRRLLVICGAEHAALGSDLQNEQFELIDWAGYVERKLTVVGVSPGTSIIFDTESFASEARNPSVHVWNDVDNALEQAADCEAGEPSLTLFGLDGGMKQRWRAAVSNDELFAIIDAMPMRTQEMWEQK